MERIDIHLNDHHQMHRRSDEPYKEIGKFKKFTTEYEKKLSSSQSNISGNDNEETENQTPTNSEEVKQSQKVSKDGARSTEREKEQVNRKGTGEKSSKVNGRKEKNAQMLLHYYTLKRGLKSDITIKIQAVSNIKLQKTTDRRPEETVWYKRPSF